MKKQPIIILLLLLLSCRCFSQLVTKKDYDLSMAPQVGMKTSLAVPDYTQNITVKPLFGLKSTIPFTRRWFLGFEINYSETDYSHKEQKGTTIHTQNIFFPIYLKRKLSNKSSIFGGANLIYHMRHKTENLPPAFDMSKWNAGIIIGFEQSIARNLNLAVNISNGALSLLETASSDMAHYPVYAGVTLSYEIFRLNDCGCN